MLLEAKVQFVLLHFHNYRIFFLLWQVFLKLFEKKFALHDIEFSLLKHNLCAWVRYRDAFTLFHDVGIFQSIKRLAAIRKAI